MWIDKTRLTSPLLIEVPVSNQKCVRSCICVLGVSNLPLSLLLDIGIVRPGGISFLFLILCFLDNYCFLSNVFSLVQKR